MLQKILKVTGWIAASALGLVVALYLLAVAINWRDRAPSAAAVHFEKLYRDRPAVADPDNAFVYFLGIDAGKDPLGQRNDRKSKHSPQVQEFISACGPESTTCAVAFDTSDEVFKEWMAYDSSLLERYRALIAHSGWREAAIVDSQPLLPAYTSLLDGQRLLLLQAKAFADHGNTEAARELLAADLRFWRKVVESSDLLISKLIAANAVKRHFEWGNLLLRRLPPADAAKAMPAQWRDPLSDSERSMLRCMVGEWMLASATMRDINREAKGLARAAMPFYQPQDSINSFAEYYSQVAAITDAPLSEYQAGMNRLKQISLRRAQDGFPPRSIYNFMGKALMGFGATDYSSRANRIADIEGVRRAALAAATLREEHVKASDVAAALPASALRNPYDDTPFAWDEKDGAIVFRGLEAGERGVHRLYY